MKLHADNPAALRLYAKLGFVKVDSIASLGVGQLCYIKEADGWKVAGVIGGIEE